MTCQGTTYIASPSTMTMDDPTDIPPLLMNIIILILTARFLAAGSYVFHAEVAR